MGTKTRKSVPSAKEMLTSLTAGKKAHKDGVNQTQVEAEHQGQGVTDQQQAQVQPDSASDQGAPAPESPSSIGPILDKTPHDQRIIDALAVVDRVDRQKLCEQLDSPFAEFNAAINRLAEGKIIKDDAISKTIYLLRTEEEKKGHAERMKRLKGHQDFIDLQWILDHRTYREDYPSWDEFLHYELCVENPHDWWEKEKCRVRVQQQMDELDVKFKVPLNKDMSKHLNKVRNAPALFAACVSEFQGLPQNRQIAKRLGEIVECHLDRKNKLASLRQFIPDVTEQELAALAPLDATDHKWRCWYPQHTKELQERVQKSGRPIRDCMLEIAQEIKSLPGDTVLLGVARGDDLVPLVSDLKEMLGPWEREKKKKDEIDAWEKQGRKLGIYKPQEPKAKDEDRPDEHPNEDVQEEQDEELDEEHEDPDEEHEEQEDAALFDVDFTGEFVEQAERMTMGTGELADLLRGMADSFGNGWVITQPSSLTIRPAVRQEQSA